MRTAKIGPDLRLQMLSNFWDILKNPGDKFHLGTLESGTLVLRMCMRCISAIVDKNSTVIHPYNTQHPSGVNGL